MHTHTTLQHPSSSQQHRQRSAPTVASNRRTRSRRPHEQQSRQHTQNLFIRHRKPGAPRKAFVSVMNATSNPSYSAACIAAAGPSAPAAAFRGALALQDRRQQRRVPFQSVARAGVSSAQVCGDAGCVRYTRAGMPSEKQAGGEEERGEVVEEGEMAREEGEGDERRGLEAPEEDVLTSSSPTTTSTSSSHANAITIIMRPLQVCLPPVPGQSAR